MRFRIKVRFRTGSLLSSHAREGEREKEKEKKRRKKKREDKLSP